MTFSNEQTVKQIAALCKVEIKHFQVTTEELRHPVVDISESKIEVYEEGLQARFHSRRTHGHQTVINITFINKTVADIYQNALDVLVRPQSKGEKYTYDVYFDSNLFKKKENGNDY